MDKSKLSLVKRALQEYGQTAVLGIESNKNILSYFNKMGLIEIKDDETPWCSAFLNAMCIDLNLPFSNRLNARSWLDVGVKTEKPEMGDIVIFWRESPTSWKGHVGIYISEVGNMINVLGGNQTNQVNISKFEKSKVLGYRSIVLK